MLHASDLTLLEEVKRRGHSQVTAAAALEATRDSRANRIRRADSGAAVPGRDESEEKVPMSQDQPDQHDSDYDDQPAQQALDQHMQIAFDNQPSTFAEIAAAVSSSEQVMIHLRSEEPDGYARHDHLATWPPTAPTSPSPSTRSPATSPEQ